MEWLVTNAIVALLLPPGSLLLLAAFGALAARDRPALGRAVVVFSLIALYALSTPYAADGLIRILEPAPLDPARDAGGQAIVVLGGGSYFHAPEYGGDTVSPYTLERLRYAARLQRKLGKPLLLTGGAPLGEPVPEAELMKRALQDDFGITAKWIEPGSNNSLENARRSRLVLRASGIHRIYLVTHAWHMPRARLAFEHAGFSVIPAPMAFRTRYRLSVLDFLPRAGALAYSSRYFHEVIGLGWYHLRIFIGI